MKTADDKIYACISFTFFLPKDWRANGVDSNEANNKEPTPLDIGVGKRGGGAGGGGGGAGPKTI